MKSPEFSFDIEYSNIYIGGMEDVNAFLRQRGFSMVKMGILYFKNFDQMARKVRSYLKNFYLDFFPGKINILKRFSQTRPTMLPRIG